MLALALAACDGAGPDFARCEQLEAERKFEAAKRACELAHSKDPESKSGLLAKARLPILEAARQTVERERDAREAKARAELDERNAGIVDFKRQFDQAATKAEALRAQVERVSNQDEKARLQRELAKVTAEKETAAKAVTGTKPGCRCEPNDPLCSCD